ncbi:STAS domain-containing protein [uncultured Cellulomonas sp.]|uniref:STAS domain-containing protein n=1 Tax=uncultured Cellulomonas sp. TaxID=189682 RepID=UPI00260B091D|nr:STAS domain-containing protein [uncultured Cellulomonas sp.]
MTSQQHTIPVDDSGEPTLTFSVTADPVSTIHLGGELDAATGPAVGGVVEEQVAQGHLDLRLDVAGLTFVDLAGFDCLRDLHRRLCARGGGLRVHGYDRLFAEVARICGLDDLLDGG